MPVTTRSGGVSAVVRPRSPIQPQQDETPQKSCKRRRYTNFDADFQQSTSGGDETSDSAADYSYSSRPRKRNRKSVRRKRKPSGATSENNLYSFPVLQVPLATAVHYRSTMQFDDLPDYAVVAVLNRVPVRNRINAERVSHRWYRLIQESYKRERWLSFWDVVSRAWDKYGELTGEPQIFLQAVLSRVGPNLQSLSFACCPAFRMSRFTLELLGTYCPALCELDLSGRSITANALEGLRNLPESLHTLKVSRCFESGSYETKKAIDRALTSVLSSLPNLRVLNAEYNKSENSWGKGGMWLGRLRLRSLSIGSCAINSDAFTSFITANTGFIEEFHASEGSFASGNWSNIDRCRKLLKRALGQWRDSLKVLELRDFSGTYSSDLGFAVRLVPSLKHLTSLSLKSNRFVNDELVSDISEKCVKLQTINLACCHSVKRKGLESLANLPDLRVIEFRRLAAVDNDLIRTLCRRGKLTVVGLRECTRITRDVLDIVLLNCPFLEKVDVTGCRKIPPELRVAEDYEACDHVTVLASSFPPSSPLLEMASRLAFHQSQPSSPLIINPPVSPNL